MIVGAVRSEQFQFTHPGRGATASEDSSAEELCKFQFTHPGRGATHLHPQDFSAPGTFQFTHPGRGATIYYDFYRRQDYVSIHAPREGCDLLRFS